MCCLQRKRKLEEDEKLFNNVDVDLDDSDDVDVKQSLTPKSDEIRKKYEEKYPELKKKRENNNI